ncbi:MAG: Hsp20/alpha crystallin family protein [Thermoanaerobaculia bacterium]|jgi:HSP20 family protein|nr:Hsp20/alpha crystallin family protein [Thermoanaerobaculia bacterium]
MTTGLIRFNPEADLFRGRMDRLFNQMLNTPWAPLPTEDVANRGFLPAVDIRETPEQLTIVAELPGLDKKDVAITIENQVLTIAGERSFEKETKDEICHRIERSYGSFSRSFTLPTNLKTDKVEAKFDNGVLTVLVPKAEETKPRKVTIG